MKGIQIAAHLDFCNTLCSLVLYLYKQVNSYKFLLLIGLHRGQRMHLYSCSLNAKYSRKFTFSSKVSQSNFAYTLLLSSLLDPRFECLTHFDTSIKMTGTWWSNGERCENRRSNVGQGVMVCVVGDCRRREGQRKQMKKIKIREKKNEN